MKIEKGFDKEKIQGIAKECGSKSVKSSIGFLERLVYHQPQKMICEVIDDVGFYGACVCKKHLRLYEIAVKQDCQRNGYGRIMIMRMMKFCKANRLDKITFRTAKNESAVDFYRRMGGGNNRRKGRRLGNGNTSGVNR